MKRVELAVMTPLLVLLSFSQLAAQTITANVDMDEQPIPGVRVVLVPVNEAHQAQPTDADRNASSPVSELTTRTATTDSSGTAVLDLASIIKPRGQTEVQIVVRVCKDGKNVVYFLQQGQPVPPEDQKCVNNKECECKDRRAGIFLLTDGDTVRVSITAKAVHVHVTSAGAGTTSASHARRSTSQPSATLQFRGFGGAVFVNDYTPATAGVDGAFLVRLGNRLSIGPTAGFQWIDSSIVSSIGSMTPGSTFANTSAGFKEGNFGGQLGVNFGRWTLGVRAGAIVASSTATQVTGFCGPTSCTIVSTTPANDTVVGPFAEGYLSRSICPHMGFFVAGQYQLLKDGNIYEINVPGVVGGVVLNLSRRTPLK